MLGAAPLRMTPEEHDRAVAVTSHAPHVLAYALSALATKREAAGEPISALAAGGFHSATRVAASSPALWSEICLANRTEVLGALHGFQSELSRMIVALESADNALIEAAFARGHRGS